MKITTTFLFLLITIVAPTIHAATDDNPLRPFNAHYIVERDDDIIAHTNISLARIGDNHWLYRSASEPTGWIATMMGVTIVEQSDWIWFDGIKVLTYLYDRSGKEKHVYLTFDWQKMKVTNNINGDPWHMEIPDATQDKLSINLALKAHLALSETDVSFPVADGGKLKTYDFKVLGKESIDTSLGKIDTLKVSRNKRGRKGTQATLWFAPDLNYLLVRMEKVDEDDELVVLKIQSLN